MNLQTTHISDSYGIIIEYCKRVEKYHFTYVDEMPRNIVVWYYLDRGEWKHVESGFCPRNLKEV